MFIITHKWNNEEIEQINNYHHIDKFVERLIRKFTVIR